MKRLVVLLLLTFGVLAMHARAEVELSFDFFHDELSPMGEWAEVDGYGYVWHPSDVDEDWSPYTDGYWTYTDAGWTWVSYEDWGGITYHYGRWTRLDDYGWCWVPGYKWGPAWVSWRKNDDYIGWAPLPPECDWDEDRGIGIWVDSTYEIGPRYFSFCRVRDFGAPVLRHVLLPRIRNVEFCFGTVNITSISYNRDYGCAFNGGFDYDYIRERCDRPVPALKLIQNTTNIYINGNRGNVFVNSPRGNALVVAAPRVAARTNYNVATRQVAVKRKFQRAAVTKGWTGLDQDATRDRLLVKMREETKGLNRENSPARKVRPEALAAVPKTVDFKAKPAALTKIPAERRNPAAAAQEESVADRKNQDNRPNRLDRNGDGRPDAVRGASTEGGVAAPGRERGQAGEKPVATTNEKEPAGLRRRPAREGAQTEVEAPEQKSGSSASAAAEKARAARENRSNNEADRMARQRERAAEVEREAAQDKGSQENAQRQRAAEAAEARRAKAQESDNAERAAAQKRRETLAERQAESAERAQAQRAQSQREAAQENARREAAERQNDNQRRLIEQRQENLQRQRAQATQEQQAESRARAAAANRERAMDAQRERAANAQRERAVNAQREQAAESRARAMENQQRAYQAQAQQRAASQAQAQQRAAAQAQAQQRAAAAAQAQQQQQRPQARDPRRGRKGEE